MEFNILQHFRGLADMPKDPFNGDEIGTSLFLTGNMGPRISEKMDGYAQKAGMSRRNFLKSSVGLNQSNNLANLGHWQGPDKLPLSNVYQEQDYTSHNIVI